MKDIFDPIYREAYEKGYSAGFDPYALCDPQVHNDAFISGFGFGRTDYEAMNGFINSGIPQKTVTKKILEDFLLAGMLGFGIDDEGYTTFQLDVIELWYNSGIEKYNPKYGDYLMAVLEENGIEILR